MGRVVGFWAKIWRLGPSDSQIRFYPLGFRKIGLHKQAHLFFRSKNKNQKLGIRSRNKRPKSMCFCPSADEQDPPVSRKLIGRAKNQTGIQENSEVLQTPESPWSSTLWIVRSASVGQVNVLFNLPFQSFWSLLSCDDGLHCGATTNCCRAEWDGYPYIRPRNKMVPGAQKYFYQLQNKNWSRITKKFKNNVFPIFPLIFCFVKKKKKKSPRAHIPLECGCKNCCVVNHKTRIFSNQIHTYFANKVWSAASAMARQWTLLLSGFWKPWLPNQRNLYLGAGGILDNLRRMDYTTHKIETRVWLIRTHVQCTTFVY